MWRQLPAAPDSERIAGEGITLSLALDLTGELATRVFFDAALASCAPTRMRLRGHPPRARAVLSSSPSNIPAPLRAGGIALRSWHFVRMRVVCVGECWIAAATLVAQCYRTSCCLRGSPSGTFATSATTPRVPIKFIAP